MDRMVDGRTMIRCTDPGLHHQALDQALALADPVEAHARAHQILDGYHHDHALAVASHACLTALLAELDTYTQTVKPHDRTGPLRQLLGSIPVRHARNLTEHR
jgi:hypothetical protein